MVPQSYKALFLISWSWYLHTTSVPDSFLGTTIGTDAKPRINLLNYLRMSFLNTFSSMTTFDLLILSLSIIEIR